MRWAVLPLLSAVLVLPPALVGLPDVAVTRSWAPHAWTRGALAQLPPGTLLLTHLPAASAGAKPHEAIGIGKFHGVITPMTPIGS